MIWYRIEFKDGNGTKTIAPGDLRAHAEQDLEARKFNVDHGRTRAQTIYHPDFGGCLIRGCPDEVFRVDGLEVKVWSHQLDGMIDAIARRFKLRRFADGTPYYKVHNGWTMTAWVLTPRQRRLILRAMQRRLPGATERWDTFWTEHSEAAKRRRAEENLRL